MYLDFFIFFFLNFYTEVFIVRYNVVPISHVAKMPFYKLLIFDITCPSVFVI